MEQEKYVLADGGYSQWYIVVDRDADEVVRYAAEQLNHYLYRVTGAVIPYHSNLCPKNGPEIKLGLHCRPDGEDALINMDGLAKEGFLIKTTGENILIASPGSRGILYGVCTFLEKICGCRWYSSKVERVPYHPHLGIGELDIRESPAFECRDVYWRDAFDGFFASHNKINSGKADISFKQGDMERFFNFHHAMLDLVPEDIYFKDHPEYYAEINGERKPSQPCLSNPDVVKIATAQVRKWIKENPSCKIFSIAQNDNFGYCQCEKCRAFDEAEGSPSASIIRFSNQIAEDIAKDYPDVLLHTFAYQYSRRAPKTLKAHDNVIVRHCDIECSFSHPLTYYVENEPDSTEAAFVRELGEWKDKTKHLYLWDYCTNFANYLSPFPNLASLQENIRLFRDCGVKGIFTEGNFSHGGGGAMAELQAYLQAKLFWDPDLNLDETINDFLCGYFGAGAPYIREHLDLWQEAVKPYRLRIFDSENAGYISDELIDASLALFNKALACAENDEVYARIDKAKLSIEYLILRREDKAAPDHDKRVDAFGRRLKKYGITEIRERVHLDFSLDSLRAEKVGDFPQGRIYYRM